MFTYVEDNSVQISSNKNFNKVTDNQISLEGAAKGGDLEQGSSEFKSFEEELFLSDSFWDHEIEDMDFL